jgi:hypothetical protein
MNWGFLNKWNLMSSDEKDLYIMLVVLIFGLLNFMGPRKSDYKNLFIAWIVFLALLFSIIGILWFLLSFRIIPTTFGAGYLDQGYWMILAAMAGVTILRLLDAITKHLKIRKLKSEEYGKANKQ